MTIDTAVCNAARNRKLYGTVSRKGDHSRTRPHRRSPVVFLTDNLAVVPRGMMEALSHIEVSIRISEQSRSSGTGRITPHARPGRTKKRPPFHRRCGDPGPWLFRTLLHALFQVHGKRFSILKVFGIRSPLVHSPEEFEEAVGVKPPATEFTDDDIPF